VSLFRSENVWPQFAYFQPTQAPINSVDGTMWYDSTAKQFKGMVAGAVSNIGGSSAPGIQASSFSSFSMQSSWSCTWSNGSAIITCPSGTFKPSDVGSMAYATTLLPTGFTAFTAATLACGAATGPSVTIASFQSSSQVTLSAPCTQNAPASAPFVWGPDETVGVKAAITAAANVCGTLIWPAGGAIVTSNPFVNPPTTNCVNQNSAVRGGVTIKGQGQTIAALVIPPNFDMTTCNKGGASACAGSTGTGSIGGYIFEDFLLTGFGSSPVTAAPHFLIEIASGSYMSNVTCTGIGAGVANLKGLHLAGGPNYLYNTQFDGCGSTPLVIDTSGFGYAAIDGSFFGDGSSNAVILNGTLVSNKSIYGGAVASTVNGAAMHLAATGAILRSNNDQFAAPGAGNAVTTLSIDVGGATAWINNGLITAFGTNATTIFLGTSGNKLHLSGTTVGAGSGTGSGINTVAGSSLFDDGGNVLPTANLISGNVFGSSSITGVAQTSGNIALTSGWSSSTVGTVSGDSQRHQWTVTVAGTPAASPVITDTFPTPFLVAPRCTLQQVGGTFTLTNPAITATTTAATITFAGTPVAAQTYTYLLDCRT